MGIKRAAAPESARAGDDDALLREAGTTTSATEFLWATKILVAARGAEERADRRARGFALRHCIIDSSKIRLKLLAGID